MKWMASLVFIAASALALAADNFDYEVANVQLLSDKAVQKEVGITEAQRTKLQQYADALNKANNEKDAELQKFGLYTSVTFRKNCLETLTAAQLKRLREITIQAAGPRALMNRTVASTCGLTDPSYGQFMKAINEGDKKVEKIKSEVSEIVWQKLKNGFVKEIRETQVNFAKLEEQNRILKEAISLQEKANALSRAEFELSRMAEDSPGYLNKQFELINRQYELRMAIAEETSRAGKAQIDIEKLMYATEFDVISRMTPDQMTLFKTKLEKTTNSEMKKREPQLKNVQAKNNSNLNKYLKQKNLDKLKSLMGKPFTLILNQAQKLSK
jgi:hypothetical protein